jgi:phage-related protein
MKPSRKLIWRAPVAHTHVHVQCFSANLNTGRTWISSDSTFVLNKFETFLKHINY